MGLTGVMAFSSSVVEQDIGLARSPVVDEWGAAQRLIELTLLAARNLVAAHELNRREANRIAIELELLRCSLEALARHPRDHAAATYLAKGLPKLEDTIFLGLWALSANAVGEWQECRARAFRRFVEPRNRKSIWLHR